MRSRLDRHMTRLGCAALLVSVTVDILILVVAVRLIMWVISW